MNNEDFQQQVPQTQTQFGGQTPPFQSVGGQPQQMPQMGKQTVMKKPMKLGWIITLVLFALSLIVTTVSGVLTMSNNSVEIAKAVDSKIAVYSDGDEGFVSNKHLSSNENGFTYSGLTKGKAYIFVFLQTDGDFIENITFDNQTIHPFATDKSNSKYVNSKTIKNAQYYYVVASGSEMNINVKNLKGTAGRVALCESKDVISKYETLLLGTMLLLIFGIATLIMFIAFITFLIIYIVKNNKYKSARSFNY